MLRARIVMVPVVAMVAATLLTSAAQPQEAPAGGDMGLPSSSSSESSQSRVAAVEALGEPVQTDFEVVTELSGLNVPTAVRFSPDGRVFVAEKAGRIKVFDSLDDATPTTIQLPGTTPTYDYLDRGFLGLALDPNFPAEPWVYGLHTRVHDGYTLQRRLPGQRWLHGRRAALPIPDQPHQRGGCRDRADTHRRQLVPTVHQPLDRRPSSSARTASSTSAPAMAPASSTSTTASSSVERSRGTRAGTHRSLSAGSNRPLPARVVPSGARTRVSLAIRPRSTGRSSG